jgi:hypothetical protein
VRQTAVGTPLHTTTTEDNLITNNETATMQAISAARGTLAFVSMAQDAKHPAKLALRKWCTANGVPAAVARDLSFAKLEEAWNDQSDASLNILRLQHGTASTANQSATHEDTATMTVKINPDHARAAHAANAAHADASNPLAPLLAYLQGQIGSAVNEGRVEDIVANALGNFALSLPGLIAEHSPVKTIVLQRPDATEYKIEGHVHPKFETLVKVASSRQANGRHPNIMLVGPTSSGKTHAVEQLAKALGLEFYTNGAISMDHQLVGFKDAAGTYHETPLRKAFGRPAIYLFDEIDSSDNSPLLALAGALANGGFEFPDVFVERHPDSIIIAAGNTWGNGATAEFVGRNKLDGAIKSRFPVRISWDYDEELERAISGNVSWAKRVQNARANARKAGVKVQIDPRMTQAGAAIIAAGMTENEAAELTYLAELSPEQRRMVEAI